MCAAVEDIHHRHRQVIAADAAEEAVERDILRLRRCLGRCERDRENGVCTEVRLIFRAVKLEHDGIDRIDIRSIRADECRCDLLVDVRNRLRDALAAELRLVTIASSSASNSPVEAPDGAAARPTEPSSSVTSASTVGLPRESMISRPMTCMICKYAFMVITS